ncbi:MAG: hypothetical protein JNG84_01170 [Archangium sp.]|nr:hypothetical protein [Archangium sp.]
MKHPLLPLLFAASGCSVLFNPDRAPATACPAGVAACPSRVNATASCADELCVYACQSGFTDVDLDPSTGCEQSCDAAPLPPNPGALTAAVGSRPGVITWRWPEASSAIGYRLCTGLSAAAEPTCRELSATRCTDGECELVDENLPDAVRVFATVRSVDACGHVGEPATTANAAPITFSPADGGWSLDVSAGCTTQLIPTGEGLGIEQSGFACTSVLLAPADGWGDSTIDVEVRISAAAPGLEPGIALLANVQGFRVFGTVAPPTGLEPTRLRRRKAGSTVDDDVASSPLGVAAGAWAHLRVVKAGGVISVQVGDANGPLHERARWFDPRGASRLGRVGLAFIGTGRADVRNFTLSTGAQLTSTSLAELRISMEPSRDGGLPQHTRGTAALETCPVLPEAVGCSGACAPAADAGCVHLKTLQTLNVDTTGLDPARPWQVSVRFATPVNAGSFFPALLSSPSGGLLTASSWADPLNAVGVASTATLQVGTWNTAQLRFDPPNNRVHFVLNGVERLDTALPSEREPPAGVLRLGGYSVIDAFIERVDLSQP